MFTGGTIWLLTHGHVSCWSQLAMVASSFVWNGCCAGKILGLDYSVGKTGWLLGQVAHRSHGSDNMVLPGFF